MTFADYQDQHMTKVKVPTAEIQERWSTRMVLRGFTDMAPAQGVAAYLRDYGRGISAKKIIALANAACYYTRRDIGVEFLKAAYKMEFGSEPEVPEPQPQVRPLGTPGTGAAFVLDSEAAQRWQDLKDSGVVRVLEPIVPATVEVEIVPDQLPLFAAMREAAQEAGVVIEPGYGMTYNPPVEVSPFPVAPGYLATMQPVDLPGNEDPDAARERLIADDRFWAQPKIDGKRMVVFATADKVWYQSRTKPGTQGALWDAPDEKMDKALRAVAMEVGPFILDGELTYLAIDKSEHRTGPQAATKNKELGDPAAEVTPTYVVFKCLFCDGMDLRDKDEEIRVLTANTITPLLVIADYTRFKGVRTFRTASQKRQLCEQQRQEGREGEVWINKDTRYLPGKNCPAVGRSGRITLYDPPMIRTKYLQDWTLLVTAIPASSATKVERYFTACEVARVENGRKIPMGNVGTGFTVDDQREIKRRFDSGQPVWIDVTAQGLTEGGVLWHARFLRLASSNPQ